MGFVVGLEVGKKSLGESLAVVDWVFVDIGSELFHDLRELEILDVLLERLVGLLNLGLVLDENSEVLAVDFRELVEDVLE